MTRIAINGFGRIGRNFLRAALAREAPFEIVAVNDLADAAAMAHLFRYDSVLGRFPGHCRAEADALIIDDRAVRVLAERDPAALPWSALGVDVVLESTGFFTKRDAAAKHLSAGARKVIISAPAADADVTIVLGVNDETYDPASHHIISNASCTTNCLAPVAKVLLDAFGIQRGFMTTTHAYTNDQNVLDMLGHKDLRRARAAAVSVIPTSTGAAKAIGLVIPELLGRMDGISMRVPVPDGSAIDLVCVLERDAARDDVNAAIRQAADSGRLAGILGYTEDPIVSIDVVGSTYSAIFDAGLTMASANLVKVVAWYDNEYGYSNRLVDLISRV